MPRLPLMKIGTITEFVPHRVVIKLNGIVSVKHSHKKDNTTSQNGVYPMNARLV